MTWWGIGASAAVTVVSGISSSRAASDASDAQTDAIRASTAAQVEAAQAARDTEKEMYYQSREDQLPWLTTGGDNLGRLTEMIDTGPGQYDQSQYYQQGMDEQAQARERFAQSRGAMAPSGQEAQLQKDAAENMQMNRGNWVNEWITSKLAPTQSLARVGQTAATNMSGNALSTGQSLGQTQTAMGNALASGYIDQANVNAADAFSQRNIGTGAVQGMADAFGTYYGNK